MFSRALEEKVRDLLERYRWAGLRAATAESCTGGLIAACITHIAGSSDVFDRGFVTYSNDAKMDMLGVPLALLEAHGAVSTEVAHAMAAGAIARSRADVAVSVTGIAGPGGGSPEKPVGLVWFGVSRRDAATSATSATSTERHVFSGDRAAVRLATLEHALALFEGALPL